MAHVDGIHNQFPGEPTAFKSMHIEPWRQFNACDFDLTSQLTILTGSNGSGKTTVLSLLGAHFDWTKNFVGTPKINSKGKIEFTIGTNKKVEMPHYMGQGTEIGAINYGSGDSTKVVVPDHSMAEFSLVYSDQRNVQGLYLNSHRSVNRYRQVDYIPSQFSATADLLQLIKNEIYSTHFGQESQKTVFMVMKESLLASAIYGEGNSSVAMDEEAREVWNGFQDILRTLLPAEVGFLKLKAIPPEILIVSRTGEFTIDSLSGGLSAIFELAWQIFLSSLDSEIFTVCLDEPENHLHPSLQRSLLPNLIKAFPKVRFIIATHSPFIITSSQQARVYALNHDLSNRISVSSLDLNDLGLSADDTLRDVLGLGSVAPIWAEEKFNSIMNEFGARDPSAHNLQIILHRLKDAGLSSKIPLAIEHAVNYEVRDN